LPLVSVVVPTRDRPAALRLCLAALAAQTVLERLEVVVVDDGSGLAVTADYPFAMVVRFDGRGPAAARNEGARRARGAILCFTDDDCVPDPDWAEGLAAAIERGADAVGGSTIGAGGVLADASELVALAPASAGVPFVPSNNLACTRAAFAAVPFDEAYPHAAGEDREWCARLVEAGYVLRVEPSARLIHRQELTLWGFLARQVRYGEGAYRFRSRGGGRAALEPAGFYVGLLRKGFAHGLTVGILVAAAQAATALGFIRASIGRRGGSPTRAARRRPT
jgi:glycosyltransferase involved in cell wall biosynthesis